MELSLCWRLITSCKFTKVLFPLAVNKKHWGKHSQFDLKMSDVSAYVLKYYNTC